MCRARWLFTFAFLFAPVGCVTETPGDSGSAGGGSSGVGNAGSGGTQPSSGSSAGGASGNAGTGGSSVGGSGGLGGTASGGAGTGGLGGSSGVAGVGGTDGGAAGGGAGAGGAGAVGGGGAAGGGTDGGGAGGGGNAGTGGRGGAGAGGTGAGGKGGAGGGTFDPCPATGDCRVLPLGDSITDGFNIPGGYRMELFSLARQASKRITFVGGSMNGPTMVDGQMFPRAHEGHSGWTIQQIDGIVPDPALNVNPHIILLHIGTNDINGNVMNPQDRLGVLIDMIVMDQPNALLVVSSIIPLPSRASAVMAYNSAIPGVINARSSTGKHVIFVDQFMGFPNNELADGVHPNQAGYDRMGAKWYAAISSYLH